MRPLIAFQTSLKLPAARLKIKADGENQADAKMTIYSRLGS